MRNQFNGLQFPIQKYSKTDRGLGDIWDIIDAATNIYNSAAPILDPIRDNLIQNIVGGGSSPAKTQQSPGPQPAPTPTVTYYYTQPAPTQPPSATGMSTGEIIAIGAAATGLLMTVAILLFADDDEEIQTKKAQKMNRK